MHGVNVCFSCVCVSSVGTNCTKCKKTAVAIARTKDPFCKSVRCMVTDSYLDAFVCAFFRECFHSYFVHRFRATFGKARLFTTGEKVGRLIVLCFLCIF